jgi:hypothetical protein
MRLTAFVLSLVLMATGSAALAQDRTYVPERRLVLTEGVDFYGSDLQSIFDTTIEACEAACLANSACTAMTFNSKANSCFLKSDVSSQDPYAGAFSGWVRPAADGAAAIAAARAGELSFLQSSDFDAALAQAQGLARQHITGDWSAEDLLATAADALANADYLGAARAQGAALNLTDAADQWAGYADMLLSAAQADQNQSGDLSWRALSASVNAYLRADNPNLQATILPTLARALEATGRGRDMIPALKLAQSLAPRDDTAAMLDDAVGNMGSISANIRSRPIWPPRGSARRSTVRWSRPASITRISCRCRTRTLRSKPLTTGFVSAGSSMASAIR